MSTDYRDLRSYIKGFECVCPVIPGNACSEAIERLLIKADTCIHRMHSPNYREVCQPKAVLIRQHQRRMTKTFLLEVGRHFLISIQYLLAYLQCSGRLTEKHAERDSSGEVEIPQDTVSSHKPPAHE